MTCTRVLDLSLPFIPLPDFPRNEQSVTYLMRITQRIHRNRQELLTIYKERPTDNDQRTSIFGIAAALQFHFKQYYRLGGNISPQVLETTLNTLQRIKNEYPLRPGTAEYFTTSVILLPT
jgi:hypothetical protein